MLRWNLTNKTQYNKPLFEGPCMAQQSQCNFYIHFEFTSSPKCPSLGGYTVKATKVRIRDINPLSPSDWQLPPVTNTRTTRRNNACFIAIIFGVSILLSEHTIINIRHNIIRSYGMPCVAKFTKRCCCGIRNKTVCVFKTI